MAESYSDSELETRKELVRKSGRVRKVTDRLQVEPKYKTYERDAEAVIMTRRKCTRAGCEYIQGTECRDFSQFCLFLPPILKFWNRKNPKKSLK